MLGCDPPNSGEASEYIQNLGKYVMEQCRALAVILPRRGGGPSIPRLDVALGAGHIFYYCYDVYSLFEEWAEADVRAMEGPTPVVLEPFRSRRGDREQTPTAGGDEGHPGLLPAHRVTLDLERLFHILHILGC